MTPADELPDLGNTDTKSKSTADLPEFIEIECGKAEKNTGQCYESNEHSDIGNYAFKLFLANLLNMPIYSEMQQTLKNFLTPSQKDSAYSLYDPQLKKAVPTQLYEIRINPNLSLSPGDIVALAGDFYADPDKPIAFGDDNGPDSKEERFKSACNKLISEPQRTGQIKKVVAHIRDDAEALKPDAHWTIKLKRVILNATDGNNIQYGYELADKDTHFWHSPFFKLAMTNFDHFGDEARVAFLTGYNLAMQLAKEARLEKDKLRKEELLRLSFLNLLFACHFLTDLFASGHVRTPRKQILNYLVGTQSVDAEGSSNTFDINSKPKLNEISAVNLVIAGIFARKMHDEDNQNGVYVKYPNSVKIWESYGDNNYYHQRNSDNAIQACEVMLEALMDIARVYNNQEPLLEKAFDNFVPTNKEAGNERAGRSPMFWVEGNKLMCRGDIVENAKAKGLIAGTIDGLSYAPINYSIAGVSMFNVKIIPAGNQAINQVKHAGQVVATTAVETKDKVIETAQHVLQKAEELGEQAKKELYDAITVIQPPCRLF